MQYCQICDIIKSLIFSSPFPTEVQWKRSKIPFYDTTKFKILNIANSLNFYPIFLFYSFPYLFINLYKRYVCDQFYLPLKIKTIDFWNACYWTQAHKNRLIGFIIFFSCFKMHGESQVRVETSILSTIILSYHFILTNVRAFSRHIAILKRILGILDEKEKARDRGEKLYGKDERWNIQSGKQGGKKNQEKINGERTPTVVK